MKTRRMWRVVPSKFSTRTVNPIRAIVDHLTINPNPDKEMIALSIGDPTIFGNLKPCNEVVEALVDSARSYKHNGYTPSVGSLEAREAVAKYESTPEVQVEPQDVILTSGCSHALELCLLALANPGDNILVPRPGFPIYATLVRALGVEVRYYDLLPENDWEVDLTQLAQLADERTAALVINNPSNPCGSVFSRSHLEELLDTAAQLCLPIVADEIYEHFVFPGETFYPLASLSREVPILSCGGLTKRFLVPGWRMGWIVIHDRNSILGQPVRSALVSLTQRILGPSGVVQGALPAILNRTPQNFFNSCARVIQKNAILSYNMLSNIQGLHPIMPRGAMYMMVRLDINVFHDIQDDMDFVEKLISEQSVFCLPGKCFDLGNYFRIVLTVPEVQMKDACVRLAEFCVQHTYRQPRAVELALGRTLLVST